MPDYKREDFINDYETYSFLLESRDLDQITQYTNKVFSKKLKSLDLSVFRYTWKQGDKLYKLAARFYGSHKLWWVIALANKISCEADLTYGDTIIIPESAQPILEAINE
mgnify:CR=1 FL=1